VAIGDTNPPSDPTLLTQLRKVTASDAAAGDSFGTCALSGDTAIVGAAGNDDAGDWSGSAYIFDRHYPQPHRWGERKKITASDAQIDDAFGGSVAISGDYAVVGADGEDAAGPLVGAAYVFKRDQGGSDNWGQVKKLMPSAPVGSIEGWGIPAIDGNIIAVGCLHSGEIVHIFYKDQGGADNWGEVKKLTAFDGATFDRFGRSLALSGNILVVGAEDDDDACGGPTDCDSGSIYIFGKNKPDVDQWGIFTKRTASDDAAGDQFGASVAISGTTIAVGAPAEDSACPGDPACDSGAVYIFERHEGGANAWGEVTKIIPADGEAGDRFGVVSISGDVLVVGAPGDDDACPGDPGCDSGSVYVYERNRGGLNAWGFVQKLTASDEAGGDYFGLPSISGKSVLVGAESNDDACPGDPNCNSGSAYMFVPPFLEVFVGDDPAPPPRPEEEH
jgi:hypothetical protein